MMVGWYDGSKLAVEEAVQNMSEKRNKGAEGEAK